MNNYKLFCAALLLAHNGLQLAAGAGKETETLISKPTRAKAVFEF